MQIAKSFQPKDYAKAVALKEETGGIMIRDYHPTMGTLYTVRYYVEEHFTYEKPANVQIPQFETLDDFAQAGFTEEQLLSMIDSAIKLQQSASRALNAPPFGAAVPSAESVLDSQLTRKENNVTKRVMLFTRTHISGDFRNRLVQMGDTSYVGVDSFTVPESVKRVAYPHDGDKADAGNYEFYISPDGQVFAHYFGFDYWYVVENIEQRKEILGQDNFRITYKDGTFTVKEFPKPYYLNTETYNLLRDGKTIQAIKALRDYRGLGLREAKNLVDLARGVGVTPDNFLTPSE